MWRDAAGSGRRLQRGFALARERVAAHQQHVHLAGVGAQHLENQVAETHLLAAMRHVAEMIRHVTADCVHFFIGEMGAERLVELHEFGERAHAEAAVGRSDDVAAFLVEVVFVLDVADDLLQHVLDRDQAGHAAVFVHDDGDVIAVLPEVVQQHVQALRLGDEHGRAQHAAHVEFLLGVIAQQILREQHADHVVAIAFVDRIARVRLVQHVRDEFVRALGDVDGVHLGARHHDVARAQLGHLEHAFDHRKRIGVDQITRVRVLENFEKLAARVGLGRDEVGQTLEERALFLRFVGLSSTGIRVVHGGAPVCPRRAGALLRKGKDTTCAWRHRVSGAPSHPS
ncbi:hypothetical protein PT2222_270013 [Paraburkholderia tropica]